MPEQPLGELKRLIAEYEQEGADLPLDRRVSVIMRMRDAVRAAAKATILPGVRAGKKRILAYMRANVGKVVSSDELAVVSGIKDYQRRIRELRLEDGWPIVSGVQRPEEDNDALDDEEGGTGLPDLRPDQYILLEDRQDNEAAARWRLANEIRRRPVGVKEKLLAYFRANVGAIISIDELRYVSKNSGDWPRRTRELRTEDGWPIITKFSGDPSMPAGTYKLGEDKQSEPHDRRISESVRRAVMKRDGWRCQWRGCGWPEGFPESDKRFLEVHHIVHHVKGGENTADNLVTLCNLHHDEVHRSGGVLDLES